MFHDVIPAKAGTQCQTIRALNAGGESVLDSRLRGNDIVVGATPDMLTA
jgi:hypothetical protein